MDICRLEQIVAEDVFSKHTNKSLILKEMEQGLEEPIERAVSDLVDYFNGTYYASKNARLDAYETVCGLPLETLVEEVCAIILPVSGVVSIQTVVGQLADILDYPDVFDSVKTAAEIVTVICYSDIYDLIPASNSETGSIMVRANYSLDDDTMTKLINKKYLPPLVCRPDVLVSNYSSSYLTKDTSVVLGKGNHHDKKLGLDALNIASDVALSLDEWVLTQSEESKKPLDTPQKAESHMRLQNASKCVYKDLMDSGNEFFFDWRFDKRGRMYSSGYHVNIQSTEYKKALINLSNKQVIRGV